MGTNLPAGFFTNKPGPLAGAGLAAMEQDRIAKLELPGAQPPETLSILDGSISPTRAAVIVDTEGGAPADDLTVISTTLSDGTMLHEGIELTIQAKDASRVITVKNSSAVNGVLTADGNDVVLGTDWWLTLRQESGSWRQKSLAQPQKVTAKDHLGVMQVGNNLDVTAQGVVSVPLAGKDKPGVIRPDGANLDIISGLLNFSERLQAELEEQKFLRKLRIGCPKFWRSTTLPANHAWPDGSFIEFEDWPEFGEVYEQGGFAGMLIPWDADAATQAANLGKFRPNAANPTGLYLPLHGGQFFQAWALGADGMAGGYNAPGLPNITGQATAVGNEDGFISPGGNVAAGLVNGAIIKGSQCTHGSAMSSSNYGKGYALGIDASKSNDIYGASSTVMPPSVDIPVILYLGIHA